MQTYGEPRIRERKAENQQKNAYRGEVGHERHSDHRRACHMSAGEGFVVCSRNANERGNTCAARRIRAGSVEE